MNKEQAKVNGYEEGDEITFVIEDKEYIMKLFKTVNEKERITILQVTHSNEAAMYGNRIINLKDGKLS